MAKRKRVAVKVYGTTIHVRPSAAKKIKAGTKRDQSQLYNPMAPLSGASLRNTALQQTNLEIAPQLSGARSPGLLRHRPGKRRAVALCRLLPAGRG
jgi:hypothetical protein